VLSVQGKYIIINDINALIDLTGVHKTKIQLAE
jgi:CRP/FNR family transcriptional regulator